MAEKEYIEREEAEKRLFQRAEIANSAYIDQTPSQIMMLAQNVVHLVHAADVVTVVRCKDCKHGTRLVCDLAGNESIECRNGNIVHRLDWFCADGAKMDGGED